MSMKKAPSKPVTGSGKPLGKPPMKPNMKPGSGKACKK